MIAFILILQASLVGVSTDFLYDPYKIEVIDECCLLVSDYANKDKIISLLDVETGERLNYIPTGRGPGEIESEGLKLISRFQNGDILVWDSVLFRGLRFDRKLNFINHVDHGTFQISRGMLVNDSLLVSIEFKVGEQLFSIYALQDDRIVEQVGTIRANENMLLEPLITNSLLRQGTFIHSDKFIACFSFSSVLLSIQSGELEYVTHKPINLELPKGMEPRISGNETVYRAPSVNDHPHGILDITADSTHIYAIISEEKGSNFGQLFNALIGRERKVHEMLDKLTHSNRLFVYDKVTGIFLREVKLPVHAKSIAISDSAFYMLNSMEEPVIYTYDLVFLE